MENPDIPTSHFVAVRSANLDTFYRIQQPKYTSEVRLMNNFLTEGKKKKEYVHKSIPIQICWWSNSVKICCSKTDRATRSKGNYNGHDETYKCEQDVFMKH